ncbi:MAG TPA: tetratricopeptide repeat protein [Pirellulales bacterium]|nr:tetratricopeptide repeat protein [Pirellulales bacterium]
MVRKSFRLMTSTALLACACAGCKSGSGFGVPVPNFVGKWMGKKDAGVSSTPLSSSASNDSNVFKKAGRSVSGAFTKATDSLKAEKKPVETPDAISLSKPGKAGPDVYLAIARIQEKNGNTTEAISSYQKALRADPDSLAAMLGLGRLYDRDGKLEQASLCYRLAIEKHPDESSAMNDLGLCYARQGNFTESVATLRRAIDADPEKLLYRNNLATVLVEMGKLDEAIAQLNAVHGKAVAHYNVAILLNERGRREGAIEHFRLAAEANPDFEPAQQWLASMNPSPATDEATTPTTAIVTKQRNDGAVQVSATEQAGGNSAHAVQPIPNSSAGPWEIHALPPVE